SRRNSSRCWPLNSSQGTSPAWRIPPTIRKNTWVARLDEKYDRVLDTLPQRKVGAERRAQAVRIIESRTPKGSTHPCRNAPSRGGRLRGSSPGDQRSEYGRRSARRPNTC